MMKFDITMDAKNLFFDRQLIKDKVDRSARRPIVKSLAFLRQRMRTQLRRRKRSSRPGQPPSVHSTDPTANLKNILFHYDMRTKSGVVGPVRLSTKANRANSIPLPGLLEKGGVITFPPGSLVITQGRDTKGRFTKKKLRRIDKARRVKVAARPNASIALEKARQAGEILSPWAHVVE